MITKEDFARTLNQELKDRKNEYFKSEEWFKDFQKEYYKRFDKEFDFDKVKENWIDEESLLHPFYMDADTLDDYINLEEYDEDEIEGFRMELGQLFFYDIDGYFYEESFVKFDQDWEFEFKKLKEDSSYELIGAWQPYFQYRYYNALVDWVNANFKDKIIEE